MADIAFESAVEQAELVRRKEVSPVELVSMYLKRIEELNPALNAYVTVAADQAMEAAAKAEAQAGAGGDLPPFLGVPISIKDLNDTAGIRTTYSSRAYADHVPEEDDAVVRRLKDAGFVVLGKTNTPEFGTWPVAESELNGQARNPWNTGHTPGGSSGGAAAALAAGLCAVSQGNDGGGSVRIPSSCCGLFGIKPSRGRVSWGPRQGEMWAGFATNGPIARTVQDAAEVLDVMAGYETGDPYWAPPPERPFGQELGTPPGRLRIALTTLAPTEGDVHADCAGAAEDTATLLAALGHEVERADPHWVDQDMVSLFVRVFQTNPAYYATDPGQMEPQNRELFTTAQDTSSVDYVLAVGALQALARRVVAFWDDYDLVLCPTLALPPVPVGWLFEDPNPWMVFLRAAQFTPFAAMGNITGQPAVSVPLHWNADGLPIGSMLIGRPGDEATLIRVSAQLEEARPWVERRPGVS